MYQFTKMNRIVFELFIEDVPEELYLIDHLQELSIGYTHLQVLSSSIFSLSVNIATDQ